MGGKSSPWQLTTFYYRAVIISITQQTIKFLYRNRIKACVLLFCLVESYFFVLKIMYFFNIQEKIHWRISFKRMLLFTTLL